MKKYFLFLSLLPVFLAGWAGPASAKKYRYIKREHGVRFEAKTPTIIGGSGMEISTDLSGAYSYNWKGMIEFGPYFQLDTGIVPFGLNSWGAGIMTEYNFIKNRGKRKLIPALGIKIGAAGGSGLNLSGGLHGALKIFVGKRTPFTIALGYSLLTPMNAPFTGGLSHKVDLSMGFSYYFDFY